LPAVIIPILYGARNATDWVAVGDGAGSSGRGAPQVGWRWATVRGAARALGHSTYRGGVFVVALVPIVFGVLVAWGGFLGLRGTLSRARGPGVRTAATLRSEEAFHVANRIAALPTLAGGAVGVLAGAAGLFVPTTGAMLTAALLGLVGMLVLVTAGGLLGNRAAERVPAPQPAASPCASCDTMACLQGTAPATCDAG